MLACIIIVNNQGNHIPLSKTFPKFVSQIVPTGNYTRATEAVSITAITVYNLFIPFKPTLNFKHFI